MTDAGTGEDLCKTCGLCCNGTLFTHLVLTPEDSDVPRKGLIAGREGDELRHPCPHHCGVCTVYDRRPTACRAYACKLLKDHMAGKVDAPQARQRIENLRSLAVELQKRLDTPIGGLHAAIDRFSREADGAEDPAAFRRANSEALLALVAYSVAASTHFGKGKNAEAVPADDPGQRKGPGPEAPLGPPRVDPPGARPQ